MRVGAASVMRHQLAQIGLPCARLAVGGRRNLQCGYLPRERYETPCFLAARIDMQRCAGVARYTRPMPDIAAASRETQQRVALLFASADHGAHAQRVAVVRLRGDGRSEARFGCG